MVKQKQQLRVIHPNLGRIATAMAAILGSIRFSEWEKIAKLRLLESQIKARKHAHCINSGVPAARRAAQKRRVALARAPKH